MENITCKRKTLYNSITFTCKRNEIPVVLNYVLLNCNVITMVDEKKLVQITCSCSRK